MNEGANKVTKLCKQDHRNASALKEDSEVDQVKPCAPINEADSSVQLTDPIIKTNSSVHLTSQIIEAGIPSKPTALMNEADIFVQPMYLNNIADISDSLTGRINEEDIPSEPTVPINESDISVQPTVKINEADISGQSTGPINETVLSPTKVSEEYQEACRIFKWIERKLDLLKILQDSEENVYRVALNEHQNISLSDKSTVLEEMSEEIRKMISQNVTEKSGYLSKEVTRMLDMLQETTLGFLDSFNMSKSRCLSIKVLVTLIQHLSASIGSKVTFQDVQTYINGKRVMQLYRDVQSAREPRYVKMAIVKRHLDHGIKKAQVFKRKSKSHNSRVDWTISECSRTIDVRSANYSLKALTKESVDLLLKYADSIKCLITKTKSFITMKTDNERVLSFFMKKEIQDLYKE